MRSLSSGFQWQNLSSKQDTFDIRQGNRFVKISHMEHQRLTRRRHGCLNCLSYLKETVLQMALWASQRFIFDAFEGDLSDCYEINGISCYVDTVYNVVNMRFWCSLPCLAIKTTINIFNTKTWANECLGWKSGVVTKDSISPKLA